MAATITPLRPPSRTADTSRPSSGSRLRVALPPPPRPLSVVERHEQEAFPCQACLDDAHSRAIVEFTARVPVPGVGEAAVLFCAECAARLPPTIRAIPVAKKV